VLRRATRQIIEDLTGVTIDQYAEVNLLGFYEISKAVAGVDVCLNKAAKDEKSGPDFPAGTPIERARLMLYECCTPWRSVRSPSPGRLQQGTHVPRRRSDPVITTALAHCSIPLLHERSAVHVQHQLPVENRRSGRRARNGYLTWRYSPCWLSSSGVADESRMYPFCTGNKGRLVVDTLAPAATVLIEVRGAGRGGTDDPRSEHAWFSELRDRRRAAT
jgi:hypothetical protein